jgi:hypothetical protein
MEAEAVCQGRREGGRGRGVSTLSGARAGVQVISHPPGSQSTRYYVWSHHRIDHELIDEF